MKESKICVYAICKNEEKFVDRWVSSLINEADYIVVLDTGSTDNTVKELRKYAPKLKVEQKIITPWRFDVARNESMKLIPNDADICCVADLDQVWRPGWSKAIRESFTQGYNEPCGDIINYAEDGSEEGRITSRNVHPNDSDYWWERPIHEGLYYHGSSPRKAIFRKDFTIEHRQDKSKTRNGYLGLLEAWYNEEIKKLPNIKLDPYCAIYYGCELSFHNRDEESKEVFLNSLTQCDFSQHPEILYQTYLNLATFYKKTNLQKALDYSLKAKEVGLETRKLYHELGVIYNKLGDLPNAIISYEKALSINPEFIGWEDDRDLYIPGNLEFELAVIYYYNKDYEKAYEYGQRAYTQLQTPEAYKNLQYYVNALHNNRKICVYAICKDEEYNVEKWFNCVKDADCVVILDTGSTDNTWNILEILASKNNNLHIYKKNYEEINFGKMRNDCLNLTNDFIQDDWVLVNLDLDEFLEDKGIELIRIRWKDEYDCMNLNGITEGKPSQIVFRKVHSARGWRWERRVHETIKRIDKKKKDWIVGDVAASYTHIQNTETKKRNYYELLQKEYEENNEDPLTLIYLAWEASLHNEESKAIEYSKECFDLFNQNKVDLDSGFKWEMETIKMQACLNLIKLLSPENNNAKIKLANICIEDIEKGLFYPCRRIYMELADAYWSMDLKQDCISCYLKALKVIQEPANWINSSYKNEDICRSLGVAYYYTGDIIAALAYGLVARDIVNVNLYYRPKYREIYGKDFSLDIFTGAYDAK